MAVVVAALRRVQTRKIPGVSLGVPHLNNRETTVQKVTDILRCLTNKVVSLKE